ncbi:MAG: hypothetical protein IKY79_01710 [Bacteroidales bacterium]|nr:hypothetical protein [Bacteroidales bacterium]
MRYTIVVAILFFLNMGMVYPQNHLKVYNILGQEITYKPDATNIVICYNTTSCHACMELLLHCCIEIRRQDTSVNLYVLLEGSKDIGVMRASTTSLSSYVPRDEKIEVIYDLNPIKRKSYFSKYHISMSPSVLIFMDNKKTKYISYEEMFGKSYDKNKINALILNQIGY